MFMPTTQSQCYAAASLMGRGTRDDTGDDDLLLQAITEDVDAIPLPVSPTPPSQESVLPAV